MNLFKPSQYSLLLIWLLGLIFALILGMIDFWTGNEYSFSIFYLFPVAMVTWYGGGVPGLLMAFTAAVIWQTSNLIAGEKFSNPFIPYWNAGTRLGFFTIVSILLNRVRILLEHERVMSRTDHLTGALNNRAFYDKARDELERLRRYNHPLSLVYFDLDNFKLVNDRFGHIRGDDLLRTVVDIVSKNLRTIDSVARLGGDKFAILLPDTDAVGAIITLERLRMLMMNGVKKLDLPVTFSMGIVNCITAPDSIDALIHLADEQMYLAKKSGKDKIVSVLFAGEPTGLEARSLP